MSTDPLTEAIAREIHQTWCNLPGHSVRYAARIRRAIKKDHGA